jgi:uncharacterized protein (TIGR00369 family)
VAINPMLNPSQEQALQLLKSAFVSIPFNRMLGLKLDSLDEKQVAMSFEMKDELIGNFMQGILHGGVISSVLDMVGGMMIMANTVRRQADCTIDKIGEVLGKCSTIDLQISYLSPGKGTHFHAKAELIKSGNKICFTRMELFNNEDKLIAMANGTYMTG